MSDDTLEILSATLMDIRVTVESMRRSVTGAQSSVEQYRHTQGKDRLMDIADCLAQLVQEGVTLEESVAHGSQDLKALMGEFPPAQST